MLFSTSHFYYSLVFNRDGRIIFRNTIVIVMVIISTQLVYFFYFGARFVRSRSYTLIFLTDLYNN